MQAKKIRKKDISLQHAIKKFTTSYVFLDWVLVLAYLKVTKATVKLERFQIVLLNYLIEARKMLKA